MPRHSFIQMSKLPNVKGRISYITSHARQENLYATYRTAENSFWNDLAKECQQEFKRSGTEGSCIEARELIIALPEVYTTYDPQEVLTEFTEEFRRRYEVECVSALHHNKRKTNYHIHLIFSERRRLAQPDIKIASQSVFYDETGKRVRTKKEITDENGKIREGCTVIPKGEIYEQHLFTVKDDRFKSEPFLHEVKEIYTTLINKNISNPDQHLKVFNPDSIYLPTKKIGKNNPKAAEIQADNAARQEWNRTADMALVSGIEEATILEIKKEEIHEKTKKSIKSKGWLPNLFRSIVNKARELLQNLIRQTTLPPKPELDINFEEFKEMQVTDFFLRRTVQEVREMEEVTLPRLEAKRAEIKGLFKGKERKALDKEIADLQKAIQKKKDSISANVKAEGYPDAQAFFTAYRKAEDVVKKYKKDLADWEQKVKEMENPSQKKKSDKPCNEQHDPPERESVRDRIRQLQKEGKQQKSIRRNLHRER